MAKRVVRLTNSGPPVTRWRPTVVLLSAAAAIAAFACGPSFQAVYECDVRFEHCYALDERDVVADLKRDCWRTWLHGYTFGQSRDRVEYASARFKQLSVGPAPSSDDAAGGATAERPATVVASPVPTNAFAPPPSIAASSSASDGGPAPGLREAALRAPGADCSDGCAHRWTTCREGCKDGACDDCDRSYRSCVPACFGDDASARQPPRSLR